MARPRSTTKLYSRSEQANKQMLCSQYNIAGKGMSGVEGCKWWKDWLTQGIKRDILQVSDVSIPPWAGFFIKNRQI